MDQESWSRPRAFNHIIESFFPETRVGSCAFDFYGLCQGRTPANRDFITYAFLTSLRHSGPCGQPASGRPGSKFRVLRDAVMVNPFVGPSQRSVLLRAFSDAQRCYSVMCTAARAHKIKHARHAHTDEDLYLRPLRGLPPRAITRLYDDASRTVYTFRMSDLIRIAKAALCSAPDFFVDPQDIRNPYTNMPFTSAQLYTLYERIRCSGYEIPPVLQLYRRCGFSRRGLLDKGEALIREEAIDAVRYAHDSMRQVYITRMLREYNTSLRGLVIHPKFPRADLMASFGHYIPTFLRTTLSLHPDLRARSRVVLETSLSQFARSYPMYGRVRGGVAGEGGGLCFYDERHGRVPPDAPPPRLAADTELRAARRARIAGLIEVATASIASASERIESMHAEAEENAHGSLEHAVQMYEAEMEEVPSEVDSDDDRSSRSGSPPSPPHPAAAPPVPPAETTLNEAFNWMGRHGHGSVGSDQHVLTVDTDSDAPSDSDVPSHDEPPNLILPASPPTIPLLQTEPTDASGNLLGPSRARVRTLSHRV